ncbi:kinase-like domain-containing protein [Xylariaceae sp. AK1471]|nr:kinase-like domain-containing protein [Xylariaceae sp. AK1471]
MSSIHVTFEINPSTHLIVLSLRSKRSSSVMFAVRKQPSQKRENVPEGDFVAKPITGDGVILYGQDYNIIIASYSFKPIWQSAAYDCLKDLAIHDYKASLKLLQEVRSRDRPTEVDHSEALSWHMTRLNTGKESKLKDVQSLRHQKGNRAFGTVWEAVDQISGHLFAIKVVRLSQYDDEDTARALLHREIKVMERLHHEHIIEYLGNGHFDTSGPRSLCLYGKMLSALDYLASENLVHRDLKPDNILYYKLPDKSGYQFQLADFGLANHLSLAKMVCGTGYYQAPELHPEFSGVRERQSPKMDVWSLLATMAAVDFKFKGFPPRASNYGDVLRALENKASMNVKFEPMGRRTNNTTIENPPLEPKPAPEEKTQATLLSAKAPPIAKDEGDNFGKDPISPASPLIVYPPRLPRRNAKTRRVEQITAKKGGNPSRPPEERPLPPVRIHRDGVKKR